MKKKLILGACRKIKLLLFFCFHFGFPLSNLLYPHFSAFFSSLSFPSPFSLLLLLLSKTIKVKVIDDEEYEKNKTFYIEIGEPRLVESNNTKGQDGRERSPPGASTAISAEAACSHHRGALCGTFYLKHPVVTGNMQQVVDHLVSPHPPLHLQCLCVCV